MSLKAIDLFSGCGGMSLGLEKAGFDVVFANELTEDAMKTYQRNFPKVITQVGDISKIKPDDVKRKIKRKRIDLIVAGTPCQGFSNLGQRNLNDPRNKLFRQLLKFVHEFKPKIFVMENVPGLMSIDNGATFEKIIRSFSKIGYHVYHSTLMASDFGVPQNRARVFIIGSHKKISEEKIFPKKKRAKPITAKQAISDLEFLDINEVGKNYKGKPKSKYQKKMRIGSKIIYNHESPNHSRKIQKRFALIRQGMNGRKLKKSGTNKRDFHKIHPRKPSRTISTLPEDFIHYQKKRMPTVRELARLQSFPDKFKFLGPRTAGGRQRKYTCCPYTQVGYAVPTLMAEAIFKRLSKTIREF